MQRKKKTRFLLVLGLSALVIHAYFIGRYTFRRAGGPARVPPTQDNDSPVSERPHAQTVDIAAQIVDTAAHPVNKVVEEKVAQGNTAKGNNVNQLLHEYKSGEYIVKHYEFGIWRVQRGGKGSLFERDVVSPDPVGFFVQEGRPGSSRTFVDALDQTVSPFDLTKRTASFLEGTLTYEDGCNSSSICGTYHFRKDQEWTFLGIPERSTAGALRRQHTYTLYNRDYHYDVNDLAGLYGTVPYILALSASGAAVGVFWMNPSNTHVTVSADGKSIQFDSAFGQVDYFVLPGPSAMGVVVQLSYLTGLPMLPPLFSLGYHQCRWSYLTDSDVLNVDQGLSGNKIPCDAIWLDIDHTNGKRYFTWDVSRFPDSKELQRKLTASKRHLVAITDPHIKVDPMYRVYQEAKEKGYFIKTMSGTDFVARCWPGDSSWLDFTDRTVREFYAEQFQYDKWEGSTNRLHFWIDMNEPAVFEIDGLTTPATCLHRNGVSHGEVHNMYGFYHSMAAFAGGVMRNADPKLRAMYNEPGDLSPEWYALERPFILSRSFFAGSQRFAAIWTGDNSADYNQLIISIPMILTMAVGGVSFAGADVGGFFGDTSPDLFATWYALGALAYPFFRGHAHDQTRRREPWLLGGHVTEVARVAGGVRYRLLPNWYTAFRLASLFGIPAIAPLALHFNERHTDPVQDQCVVVGDFIVTCLSLQKQFPQSFGGEAAFNLTSRDFDYDPGVFGEYIRMFQIAGTILTVRNTVPASTEAVPTTPGGDVVTLRVVLDKNDMAWGSLYVDDGVTYQYQTGAYAHVQFAYEDDTLCMTRLLLVEEGIEFENRFLTKQPTERAGWKSVQKAFGAFASLTSRSRLQKLAARAAREQRGDEGHTPPQVGAVNISRVQIVNPKRHFTSFHTTEFAPHELLKVGMKRTAPSTPARHETVQALGGIFLPLPGFGLRSDWCLTLY